MFVNMLSPHHNLWQLRIQGITPRPSVWPHLWPLLEEANHMMQLMIGRTLALQLRSRSPRVAKLVTHAIDFNISRIAARQPSVGMRLLTLATE